MRLRDKFRVGEIGASPANYTAAPAPNNGYTPPGQMTPVSKTDRVSPNQPSGDNKGLSKNGDLDIKRSEGRLQRPKTYASVV